MHLTTPRASRWLASLCLALAAVACGQSARAASFVAPGGWNVGDANSTYQAWDFFTANTGNTPDVGYQANAAISTGPTTDAVSPGFVIGSGNFYYFGGDHGFKTTIYNHGGASGTGGLPAGSGTHVIVQTSTVLNGSDGIYPASLQIVDGLGDPLAGGGNGDALRHSIIGETTISTSQGPSTERDEIWEFFLPNFTSDFMVLGDLIVHSSFDEIRVDTMIASSAFAVTTVPEPATWLLMALGMAPLGLALRRRRRLAAQA